MLVSWPNQINISSEKAQHLLTTYGDLLSDLERHYTDCMVLRSRKESSPTLIFKGDDIIIKNTINALQAISIGDQAFTAENATSDLKDPNISSPSEVPQEALYHYFIANSTHGKPYFLNLLERFKKCYPNVFNKGDNFISTCQRQYYSQSSAIKCLIITYAPIVICGVIVAYYFPKLINEIIKNVCTNKSFSSDHSIYWIDQM